jgi:hypothetical protein
LIRPSAKKVTARADKEARVKEPSSYSAEGCFFFNNAVLAVSSAHLSITPFEADVIDVSVFIAK